MPRLNISRMTLNRLFSSAAVVLFAIFVLELPSRYWSDSEIWAVRQGSICVGNWSEYACSWKPLFNLLMSAVRFCLGTHDIFLLMTAARGAVAICWGFILFLALRRKYDPALLVCYFGSSLFLLDSSVARSDFFALSFLFFHVVILCDKEILEKPRGPLWLVLTAAGAVLFTPKALISLLAFLPLERLATIKSVFDFRAHLKKALALSLFLLCVVIIVSWQETTLFFLRLFNLRDYGSSYFSMTRFHYLLRTCSENPQIFLLILVWLSGVIGRVVLGRSRAIGRELWSAFLLTFVLVFFPDKLPFWISSQIFLLLFLLGSEIEFNRVLRVAADLAACFTLIVCMHWVFFAARLSNERQLLLLSELEHVVVANPDAKVYDGIGLAPLQKSPSLFFGPGSLEASMANIGRLSEAGFDVIVLTHKLRGIYFLALPMFSERYNQIAPDIFVRKNWQGSVSFRNRFRLSYTDEFSFEPPEARPSLIRSIQAEFSRL
jgi:hypothetical protein